MSRGNLYERLESRIAMPLGSALFGLTNLLARSPRDVVAGARDRAEAARQALARRLCPWVWEEREDMERALRAEEKRTREARAERRDAGRDDCADAIPADVMEILKRANHWEDDRG